MSNPVLGEERPMSYEKFHTLLGVDGGADPCEAIFGDDVTWPDYSYQNTGDPYRPGWIYDHKRHIAFFGAIGTIIEEMAEGEESCE